MGEEGVEIRQLAYLLAVVLESTFDFTLMGDIDFVGQEMNIW